jgi:hypothetical protein
MTTVNSVILRPAFPGGFARMAELVDASDSKSGYRKVVQVRFLFRAQNHETRSLAAGFAFGADLLWTTKHLLLIQDIINDLSS